jgi:hypothetical protein
LKTSEKGIRPLRRQRQENDHDDSVPAIVNFNL